MRTRFIAVAAATTLATGMLVVPGAGAETSSSELRTEIAAAEKAVKSAEVELGWAENAMRKLRLVEGAEAKVADAEQAVSETLTAYNDAINATARACAQPGLACDEAKEAESAAMAALNAAGAEQGQAITDLDKMKRQFSDVVEQRETVRPVVDERKADLENARAALSELQAKQQRVRGATIAGVVLGVLALIAAGAGFALHKLGIEIPSSPADLQRLPSEVSSRVDIPRKLVYIP